MSNFQDPQAHNTRGLKKFTGNKYKLGERVVSTCDRTIDGRSNALHQLPPKKHTRAPPTSKLFPSKLTLSGVIAVHDLFPRFWNACVLVLLSLSFSLVYGRENSRPRGWKYKGVVAPNFRARSLSRSIRRRTRLEQGNEAKGWLCSWCREGGRRNKKEEREKREKTVRFWVIARVGVHKLQSGAGRGKLFLSDQKWVDSRDGVVTRWWSPRFLFICK